MRDIGRMIVGGVGLLIALPVVWLAHGVRAAWRRFVTAKHTKHTKGNGHD